MLLKNNMTKVFQSGFLFNIRIDKSFQDIKIINEIIAGDQYELKELSENIPEPKIIIDVGGHIGTFGIFAKSLWPKAKIIAIEPNPINAALYRMNLKDIFNDTESVVINKAISYSSDNTVYVGGARTTGGGVMMTKEQSMNIDNYRFSDYVVNSEITTIEEILEEFKIDKVDLIKWDCEGGEIDAFKNMKLETKKKLGFMVGETHTERGLFYIQKEHSSKCITDILQMWNRIRRWMSTHFFDYTSAEGFSNRSIFKAWPKGN
jgi:FkbM family methyltransferase